MASGLLVTQKGLNKMATRALIGMQVENGIKTMYCHHDGYISHMGNVLLTSYTGAVKVAQLVAMGSVSGLHAVTGDAVDKDPYTAATMFAGATLSDLWDEAGQEYEYLFTLEGTWLVRKSEYGREVGAWHRLELGDNKLAKMGEIYQAEEPKPAKAPAPAPVPTVDPDSFLGIFARLGDLPASKRAKVLPALKALLEMAEG